MILLANLLDVWGTGMWRASWQGGLAALVVWSVCQLVPSIPARFQCWLWRLVVLKFLVALVWSNPIPLPLLPAPEMSAWPTSEPFVSNSLSTEGAHVAQRLSPGPVSPLLLLFVAWLVFVLWQMAWICAGCRTARRLRNGCNAIEDRLLLDRLAQFSNLVGLAAPPQLLQTGGQGSPLLVGILRPTIVLPTTTFSQLDAAERVLVIGHELAHVARRDLLFSLIAAITRAAFFFHPLAWLSERQLRLTQEFAADELAIALQKQHPARYASLLVSVVSKLGPHRVVPAMSVGVAGSHRSIKRRLSAMRFIKQVSSRIVIAYGLVLGLVAVLGLVPWSLVAAKAPAADQAEPKETTVSGKFVSFKDGVLKIQVKEDQGDVWQESEWKVAEDTKVVSNIPRGAAKESIARDAFIMWEPGALIAVKLKDGKVTFVEIGIKRAAERGPEAVLEKAAINVGQKEGAERGQFVSFTDGTLTLQANSGALFVISIPADTKTFMWSYDEGVFKPADTAETLRQTKAGTWFVVRFAGENVTIHIGARKAQTVGTFVSFKNDRLLLLGKNLGESYVKKYGNNLHFHKFRDDVPAYESVDGGEYMLIGTANKVLSNVKEGTVVTIHGEGDDNITRVQIGVPKTM